MSPEPPWNRHGTTTSPAADRAGSGGDGGGGGAWEVLDRLGPAWRLTPGQRTRLAPGVAEALRAGWPAPRLAEVLGANPDGVRSPAAVLTTRLAELPAPGRPDTGVERPPWCGGCAEPTRLVESPDGASQQRCPRCHPLRVGSTPDPPSRPGKDQERPTHPSEITKDTA